MLGNMLELRCKYQYRKGTSSLVYCGLLGEDMMLCPFYLDETKCEVFERRDELDIFSSSWLSVRHPDELHLE